MYDLLTCTNYKSTRGIGIASGNGCAYGSGLVGGIQWGQLNQGRHNSLLNIYKHSSLS